MVIKAGKPFNLAGTITVSNFCHRMTNELCVSFDFCFVFLLRDLRSMNKSTIYLIKAISVNILELEFWTIIYLSLCV